MNEQVYFYESDPNLLKREKMSVRESVNQPNYFTKLSQGDSDFDDPQLTSNFQFAQGTSAGNILTNKQSMSSILMRQSSSQENLSGHEPMNVTFVG